MRTDKEKYEFAIRCREIEKEGGNVLDYIRREWPSYTPRGTWINIQKHILHRKNYELKDGLPKEAIDVSKFQDIANALRERPDINGDELRALIESFGYTDPVHALANIKQWVKKNDPECFAIISPMVMRGKKAYQNTGKKAPQTAPKVRTEEIPKEKPEAPAEPENPVTDRGNPDTNGRKYSSYDELAKDEVSRKQAETENAEDFGGGYMPPEDLANDIFGRMLKEGKITKCCAPAKPSGVTVPDEISEEVVEYNGKEYERAKPEKAPDVTIPAKKISVTPESIVKSVRHRLTEQVKPEKKRKKPRLVEIETDLGSYRKNPKKIEFRRADDESDYINRLAMYPEQWRQLAEEIEDVLAMLEYIEE